MLHDKWCILCSRIGALASGNCKKEERKIDRGVVLLQNIAPAHTSQVAMTAATEYGFEVLAHPPYSHNIWPLLTSICSQN